MVDTLVCPKCKVSLLRKERILFCDSCGLAYPVEQGVYDFLGGDGEYWGEISQQEMSDIVGEAKTKGWKEAVRDLGVNRPYNMLSVISNARADWLFHCLDRNNVKSCLDIGSGWGANIFSLARHYDEAWSLDSVGERIEFQKTRKEQDGINNIYLVRADGLELPFPGNSFDLVCVNGVLEWTAIGDNTRNPREIQLDFLREVRKILQPEGCLYIGIENRYGLPFLLGSKDHSGLPFSGVLPRRIADIQIRLFKKLGGRYRENRAISNTWEDYRTYTYSVAGYRKLLEEAGFSRVDLYWTLTYSHPKYSGRLDGESFKFLLKFLREHSDTGKLGSILTTVGVHLPKPIIKLFSFLSPCFLIFAYKGQKKETLFENQLLQTVNHTSFIKVSGSHGSNSKVSYFLLRENKLCSVIKFPRFKSSGYDMNDKSKMVQFNQMRVVEKNIDNLPISIEQALQGKPCRIFNPTDNKRVLNWLLDFQNKTQKGIWDFKSLEDKIRILNDLIPNIPIDGDIGIRTKKRIEIFLESLVKVKITKNAEHGDFSPNNILIGKDEQIYVIDWESYQDEGDPLFDMAYFIISSSMRVSKTSILQGDAFIKGKYYPILKFLIKEFSKAKGLPPELLLHAVPYVILRRLHRTISGVDDSHIDITSYISLLESWDTLCLSYDPFSQFYDN